MKITLAVDEEVLAAARKYAAVNNTTVNSLVREYLTRLATHGYRGGANWLRSEWPRSQRVACSCLQ